MDLRDLATLAAEIQSRANPARGPDDPDPAFDDRAGRLETTFGGAGVLSGDITPECTALVNTVLDALSAPQGAEDTRSHEQSAHDALEEATQRLVSAGLLPERAGRPAKAIAHISLADLMVLDVGSTLQKQWTERVRGQWLGTARPPPSQAATAPPGSTATPPRGSRATRPSARSCSAT